MTYQMLSILFRSTEIPARETVQHQMLIQITIVDAHVNIVRIHTFQFAAEHGFTSISMR